MVKREEVRDVIMSNAPEVEVTTKKTLRSDLAALEEKTCEFQLSETLEDVLLFMTKMPSLVLTFILLREIILSTNQ